MAVSINVIAILFFGVVFINAAQEEVYVDPNNPNQHIHKTKGPWVTRIHRTRVPIPAANEGDVPRSALGCFRDSLIKRILPQKHDFPDNSPKRCTDLCLQSGYQYAGVQFGQECWCGSEKPLREFKINDNFCDMNCPNNPSEKCGGDLSMIVYYTGLPSGDSHSTMGCIKDSFKRVLPQLHYLLDNSPARCIDVCLQSGHQYAGVQFGAECWCGSEKPSHDLRINDDQCNMNCPQNPLLKCGGYFATNVFYTGLQSGAPHSTLGCLKDSTTRILPEKHDLPDNSPARCIDVCLQSGHQYAGVEFGTECWCGNKKPLPELKTTDDSCYVFCPQSLLLKCGGFFNINVFHTGFQSESR